MKMKKFVLLSIIVSLALCACHRVEMHDEISAGGDTVYQLDMSLGMGMRTRAVSFGNDGETITSQFQDTDCIYVYNETKHAFARTWISGNEAPLTALHPKNISGNFCNLSGSLTFYVWDEDLGDFGEWKVITVDDGDSYSLFYQMNQSLVLSSAYPMFDYSYQDGSATSASAHDFAAATGITMAKTASTLTAPEGVVLGNLQSLFRLQISFTDEDSNPMAAIPSISAMTVSSANETLVYWYEPTKTGDEYEMDLISLDIPVVFSEDNDIYLSLAFHYDSAHPAADDELILTAKDTDNNIYEGVVTVPSGGFVASNYYYGELTMEWKRKSQSKVLPVVTREDGGDEVEPESDGKFDYNGSSEPDPTQISISGDSRGYYFNFGNNAVVTLGGDGAAVYAGSNHSFLFGEIGLSIILASNYSIDCRNYETAIWADWGYLTLATTGESYTLTVMANKSGYRGLYGDFNYVDSSYDPGVLAASGFSVSLSGTTEGPDNDDDGAPDYYTWVYTVSPQN